VEHGGRTDIARVREREHALRQFERDGQDHLVSVDRHAELEHELSTSERDSGNLQDACVATVRQAVVPAGMPRAREAHNVPERARSRTKRHA
jgi:hypothetical protein